MNKANPESSLANITTKFRFYGLSAHAAGAPEKGRSALDAAEAFNFMVNMMREHVPSDSRIHYVITQGGKAPNVVPDFAEVYMYARHPQRDVVKDIFSRMVKAAEGAAMGTGTTMKYEIIGGVYDLLPNITLAKLMYNNLLKVGGLTYTEREQEFAKNIQQTFTFPIPNYSPSQIQPFSESRGEGGGSTDVGDVSWNVPTVELNYGTWVPGVPAHSWQAVACGSTSIGMRAMMNASKILAQTGIDLFIHPEIIRKAKEEFNQKKGKDFHYEALLGDRKPALNYRD